MSCEHWINKYWTIAPGGNTRLVSCEPLVTILLSINQQRYHEQKHKNAKHVALNRPWKGHLLTLPELRQEGRSSPWTPAGNMCLGKLNFLAVLCTSRNDHKNAERTEFWSYKKILVNGRICGYRIHRWQGSTAFRKHTHGSFRVN